MKKLRASSLLIREFVSLQRLALVGVSSNPKKFGYIAWRDLRKKGWDLVPVSPKLTIVDGVPCYPSLASLPFVPEGVISMVPASVTLSVLREAHELGIRHVWIQQQSESPEAIVFCADHHMKAIFGECVLMHFPPVRSIHALHRWLKRIFVKPE